MPVLAGVLPDAQTLVPLSGACVSKNRGLGACSLSAIRPTAFQTQVPTGASPAFSAFPNRSVACYEYPKWILLCHVYQGCPGLLICFGLFVLHMTYGQVFHFGER